MSFTSNIQRVNGSAINSLISGRIDANAQVVGDKTGYALTAGSYSIRASSTQRGRESGGAGFTGAGTTIAISSVTTTRATEANLGTSSDSANAGATSCRIALASTTTLSVDRDMTASTNKASGGVTELF